MHKSLITFIIINLLTFSLAFAEGPIVVSKDDKAPFTGFLFDIPAAQEIRKKLLEAELNSGITESYKKSIELYKSNESLYKDEKNILIKRNDELAIQLYKEHQTNDWTKVMWFGVGVITTGLAVYAAAQITK